MSLSTVLASKLCKLSHRRRSRPNVMLSASVPSSCAAKTLDFKAGFCLRKRIVSLKVTAMEKYFSASPSASNLDTFPSSSSRLSRLSSENFPTSNIVTARFFKPYKHKCLNYRYLQRTLQKPGNNTTFKQHSNYKEMLMFIKRTVKKKTQNVRVTDFPSWDILSGKNQIGRRSFWNFQLEPLSW